VTCWTAASILPCMPALRGLLLDVGGTLLPNASPISQEAHEQLCVERLTTAFRANLPWFRALVSHEFAGGGVDPQTLRQDVTGELTRFLADLGVTPPPEQVTAIRQACVLPLPAPFPETEDALREARSLGLRIAACSNTFWRDDEDMADDWLSFGLSDCFDAYVSSESTGYAKPHRAMFERAMAAIGVRPPETAMVGDRLYEDITGGRGAGLRTIWLQADAQDPPEPMPDAVIGSLSELADVLRAWASG
jgi:FMN phosphatase YigB (HAD superfamily)